MNAYTQHCEQTVLLVQSSSLNQQAYSNLGLARRGFGHRYHTNEEGSA